MRTYRTGYHRIVAAGALLCLIFTVTAHAQTRAVTVQELIPHVLLTIAPSAGSFEEGSIFDVPILLNSKGAYVNGVSVTLTFDAKKLTVVRPSGGISIIGIWTTPPAYDNTNGTVRYEGVIPSGIKTERGLIGTVTFKANYPGRAAVSIRADSEVLMHDGFGTRARVEVARAEYTILPKAPDGVVVYSDTHPFQSEWYNNYNPVLSWDTNEGVTAFSYELDTYPNTVPDNVPEKISTFAAFENLSDGLWYFHIKAQERGVWGRTGHFLIRIDATPPAQFKPQANYLLAAAALVERALIEFSTTDNLSGIDHYEVGVIDKSQSTTISPVFVHAESPYQVPLENGGNYRVIVRATDRAGNSQDALIDVTRPPISNIFIREYFLYFLIAVVAAGFAGSVVYYLVRHHIVRRVREFKEFLARRERERAGREIE